MESISNFISPQPAKDWLLRVVATITLVRPGGYETIDRNAGNSMNFVVVGNEDIILFRQLKIIFLSLIIILLAEMVSSTFGF